MKIGIDIRMWEEKGLGRYVRNLVKELVALDLVNEYVVFGLKQDADSIRRIVGEKWKLVIADVRWYTVSEQLVLPWVYGRENLDLLHVPHFNVPIFYNRAYLVTIHDLTHFSFKMRRSSRLPWWLYEVKHHAYNLNFRLAVLRAKKVLTVSNYVKNELEKRFGVKEKRVEVIYEAAEECRKVSGDQLGHVLRDYAVAKRFFYYIGNAHPHKNLEFLLQVFAKFRELQPDVQLILSGNDSYFWPRLKKWAEDQRLAQNVVFTGKVDDQTKDIFLQAAVAYVFPSLSEGFGLPMLEAMSCGCAVLAADKTSLPEIGGRAVGYFDPTKQNSLLEKMKEVFNSEEYRMKLVKSGYERVQDFSWKKLGAATLRIYQACV